MRRPDPDPLYSDFVSAIFVALLFTWVYSSVPLVKYVQATMINYLPHALLVVHSPQAQVVQSDESRDKGKTESVENGPPMTRWKAMRAILLFPAILCIWWWYQMHLAKYAPARTLPAYAIDFVTLLCFATATFYWSAEGRIFYIAISIPTLAMIGRFISSYSSMRLPWIKSIKRYRMNGGLFALAVFIVSLLVAVIVDYKPQHHNQALLVCMIIGVAVTFVGAGVTDGLRLTHMSPLTRRSDTLVFLPPANCRLTNKDISTITALDHLAISGFEADLVNAPAECRYVHLSNVHSLSDVRVHSFILALASVSNAEEIRRKCYLTYAAHWFDDLFDREINNSHRKGRMVSDRGRESYNVLNHIDTRYHNIINTVAKIPLHSIFVQTVLYRLILGSIIFKKNQSARAATKIHLEYIIRTLKSEVKWSLQNDVIKIVENTENATFIHLTTKTVQELWFACESERHPFGYTMLYSILYGPALYYHNVSHEIACGEMAEQMGASGPLPGFDKVANMIEEVGAIIARYNEDKRRMFRKMQILTMANSFQMVLDERIRNAYVKVAGWL